MHRPDWMCTHYWAALIPHCVSQYLWLVWKQLQIYQWALVIRFDSDQHGYNYSLRWVGSQLVKFFISQSKYPCSRYLKRAVFIKRSLQRFLSTDISCGEPSLRWSSYSETMIGNNQINNFQKLHCPYLVR